MVRVQARFTPPERRARADLADPPETGYRRRVTIRTTTPPPPVLRAAAAWSWRLLLIGAALAVSTWVLVQLWTVVLPLVLSLFLASVLEPLAGRLRRRGWPPALAAVTVFVSSVAILVLIGWWLVTAFASELSHLQDQVQGGLAELERWAVEGPLGLSEQQVGDLRAAIEEAARASGSGLADQALGTARMAIELVAGVVLLLFVLFFLIKDGELIGRWVIERLPSAHREDVRELGRRGRLLLRRYLLATALTGVIDAVLIGGGLVVIGVPAVLPLTVLTFFGAFFPLVGATLAGALAALVALVSGGFGDAIWVLVLTVVVQQVEGNVLQPFFMDRAMRLHPIVIVVAVGAGILVAGLSGAFLAVPIVAVIVTVTAYYREQRDELLPVEDAAG
ncbi:MAG: AI-2E family transporter [Acidimicrobiia bacterium]|nr:AI-2E family transporter [Acidimicrobiia bacterium]